MKPMSVLETARRRKGSTQAQVAEKLGITQPTYGIYERNPEKIKAGLLKKMLNSSDVLDTDYLRRNMVVPLFLK